MNKNNYLFLLLAISFSLIVTAAEETNSDTIKQLLEEKLNSTPLTSQEPEQKAAEKKYSFNYQDVLLTDIINELAAEKKVNVLLPQGAQAITTKIKYVLAHKVTIDEAWDELGKILELLGYSWELKNNQLTLLKIDANIQREPLSLYINPPLEQLPNNGQVVQAIFYLANLKVNDPNSPLDPILKAPTGMLSPTALVKTDPKTNALLIVDKADTIRAAMLIIRQLDLEGIPDAIQVIPLYYVQSSFVEDLFKRLLATAPQGPTAVTQKTSTYFPPNTKVLALTRTNNIVIMGTIKAIRIVKEFIVKYIDHPLDSGNSILSVRELQYLNAEQFAPILQQLVNKRDAASQSQGQTTGGPRRDFQDVIIEAEKTSITAAIAPTTVEGAPAAAVSSGVQHGGNRIVIAARREDRIRINRLVDQLDTPNPQVAIEVLVVDLTLNHRQIIGTQMRSSGGFNSSISDNVNFQTTNLASALLIPGTNIPSGGSGSTALFPVNALAANLLQFISDTTNIANSQTISPPGSIIISLNDPNGSGIWQIWQILDQYTNATVLTQPFITTANNTQATISFSQDRLLAGGPNSDGGAITIKNEYVTAATAIDILPIISLGTNNINLQINITVNEFLSDANNRATRLVQTNANVGNGEILALGGLIREIETITESRTPLLSQIPLFGWLFKKREKVKNKTNLMIFVCPRIIQPRVGGGIGPFSQNKLCLAENNLQEASNFEDLRDPITRWFFKPEPAYACNVIEDFVNRSPAPIVPEPFDPLADQEEKLQKLEELLENEENPLAKNALSSQSNDPQYAVNDYI